MAQRKTNGPTSTEPLLERPRSPAKPTQHQSSSGTGGFAVSVTGDGNPPGSATGKKEGAAKQQASDLAMMVGHKNLDTLLNQNGGVSGIIDTLGTDSGKGVTVASLTGRVTRYGKNELPPEKLDTFMDFVKETLEDRTMQVLIGAAVISLIMGMTTPDPRTGEVDRSTGWIEGFAILLSVAIVTILTAVNNHQKQEQFASIVGAETLQPIVVVREGIVTEIPPGELVVGDLVMVFAGMSMSFDALLVEGNGFSCDESSVTGEVEDTHKSPEHDPFLISGTNIVDGCDGICVVVAVGTTSFAGAIAMSVREKKKDTPLQEQLTDMADLIGKFGLAAAIFTFVSLLVKELWMVFFHGSTLYAMKFFENLTTAVAIVVVAVPEGLPLSVTLSLAYSMRRMFEDGNLVRHLAACETMGGATIILTDKTGTLTQTINRPVKLLLERNSIDISGPGSINLDHRLASQMSVQRLVDCINLNYSNAFGNNKTAEALVGLVGRLAGEGGSGVTAADSNSFDKHSIQRFAFSSIRKQGSVVIKDPASSAITHYVSGAAELVFQRCTHVIHEGSRVPLNGDLKKLWETHLKETTTQGLRTLTFAFSERTTNWSELPRVAPEDPLTLIGIVGIEEPIRPEVPSALASCIGAGLRVVMVTGDNSATALNVSQRAGLTSSTSPSNGSICVNNSTTTVSSTGVQEAIESGLLMEGLSFREASDDYLITNVLPNLKVLARATPMDKRRLVALYRSNPSAVVAVTGDGTNDAPALKAADVGFAMNSGSDIAKQASDIVLLQDNFTGVVKAVMWGRNVRGNIRKFLQFQLTVNLVACITAFSGAVLNSQNMSPLKPVQLLWLNLIMDTLAALALATELPSEQTLMSRPPDPKDMPIITVAMKYNIYCQCALQLLSQVYLMTHSHIFFGVPFFGSVHLTIIFNAFVMMQVFNFFNARLIFGESSLFQNWRQSQTLLYIVGVIFLTQVAIVQRGGKFMSTVALDTNQWLFCIALGSWALPVGTFARAAYRRKVGM